MTSGQEWQAWLGRHGPAMLLLARQWVPNRSDAEDVVREAFLRFWRSPQRAESSVADPVAYLFGCVKHVAMDWQRGGRRRAGREQAVLLAAAPNQSVHAPMLTGGLEREERRLAVEAALARLPEAQREVLVMKVWAGLSFPQIAHAIGIPPPQRPGRSPPFAARTTSARPWQTTAARCPVPPPTWTACSTGTPRGCCPTGAARGSA